MFSNKAILFGAAFMLTLQSVASNKCVYVHFGYDENSYVECKNVNSMSELLSDIKSDWKQLKIVNDIDGVFTTSENIPSLEYVLHLDVSEAGTLHLSDVGFRGFSQLMFLNMSRTRVSAISNSWFSRSNNLQTLDISWNKLFSLKEHSLRTLSKIIVANFSHNEIEDIETFAFDAMRQMRVLDLSHNRIASLFDLGDLPALEVLNLDENFLVELPPNGFSKLRRLQTLTLSQNTLSVLHDACFDGLDQLKLLNISGNRISTIRKGIFEGLSTIRLQQLDFNNNDISLIELNDFQDLHSVQILDLSGNSIKDLQEHSFYGLNSLRKLYLFNNDILNMQRGTFAALQNLEELDLSGNSLQSLSADVFTNSAGTSPTKLRKLFIRRNNLIVIQPHTFDRILNLDYLSVAFNSISSLDENLFTPLRKLKKLHINHNNLEDLPAGLFNTTLRLQELYIDYNKLSFFPDTSNDFSDLIKVSLVGNPWQCPCLNEILDWVKIRGIEYKRATDSPFFSGLKPICVVTPTNSCIRSRETAKEFRIAEKYENSLNLKM